ncbi:MAG: AAA family ATPase [Clostridiaceae bacterium]|nr:AAA family ATPase [Clostridiaceae bacterium]
MTIDEEIIEWSSGRPIWQRDALRRIVCGEQIDETAIDEIFKIALRECLFDEISDNTTAIPLEKSNFLPNSVDSHNVILNSISEVKNINALAGISPIEFSPSGLTLIYGGNGSGKSSYVRILKKICSCRDIPHKILPNVYLKNQSTEQNSTIKFTIDDEESTFKWNEENNSSPELKLVHVFDSKSGSIFVTKENDLAFIPLGIDVFKALGEICGLIKEKIDSKILKLQKALPEIRSELRNTDAALWLSRLSHNTTEEDADKWTSFTVDDENTLNDINEKLQKDPLKISSELESKAKRYKTQLLTRIEACKKFEDEKVEELKKANEKLKIASRAWKLASDTAFNDSNKYPVSGVGSAAWRALWETARHYSESVAYPNDQYPLSKEGGRCVLCHQLLQQDARKRFKDFETFVKDDTASKFGEAAAEFDIAKSEYENFNVFDDIISAVLDEIKNDEPELEKDIRKYLESAKTCCDSILTYLQKNGGMIEKLDIPNPELKLQEHIESIVIKSKEFNEASKPEEIERLKKDKLNLEGKRWLSENNDKIIKEIKRLTYIRILNTVRNSTNTRGITEKSNQMVEKYVGEELRNSFEKWISDLSPQKFKVVLNTRGDHGVTYHSLSLVDPNDPTVSVADIVSEGEHRALALAAFLTELCTFPHKSCVVFDDPVSSLDHIYRKRVADSLVSLAKERQIIIFTHDIYFLLSLIESSKKYEVKRKLFQLLSDSRGTGIYDEDIPFQAKDVNNKIRDLNKLVQTAKKIRSENGDKACLPYTFELLNKFRTTLERSVEEVYVNDVVARYKWNITTKGKIGRLGKIEPDDCIFIDDMMDRYSTPLHDPGVESPPPPPTLEEIENDIIALKTRITEIRNK